MADAARDEKQEPLRQRVVDDVEEHCREAGHREARQAVRPAEQAKAQAEREEAGVFDGAVGEDSLEIVLREREQGAADPGRQPDGDEDPGPCGMGGAEEREQAEDAVEAGGDHRARHEGGDMARGGGVRLGEPDVERGEAGFHSETEEAEPEQDSGERRKRVAGGGNCGK